MNTTERVIWRALLIAVCFLGISTAGAEKSILYWTDGVAGDDAMAGALSSLAMSEEFDIVVTTATGGADFATKIGSGNYDLGILFIQNDSSETASTEALADFADAGGLAMYANFDPNSDVSRFGFQHTGVYNEDEVTITDAALEEPETISSSVTLASPGWTAYSFGLSLTGSGDVLAEFGNGDAAVVRTFFGGRVMGFGMLNDTFASTAEGEAFFTNAIIAIPEPSTWGAVFGAIVLAGALIRRRRNRTLR